MARAQAESTPSRSWSFRSNGHTGSLTIEYYPLGWSARAKAEGGTFFLEKNGTAAAAKFIVEHLKSNQHGNG